jgi:hypothetical protein
VHVPPAAMALSIKRSLTLCTWEYESWEVAGEVGEGSVGDVEGKRVGTMVVKLEYTARAQLWNHTA